MKVRVFIKPYCAWNRKARCWLNDRDIQYRLIDVVTGEDAFNEMIELSQQDLTPVTDVHGQMLAGFARGELQRFPEAMSATRHHDPLPSPLCSSL